MIELDVANRFVALVGSVLTVFGFVWQFFVSLQDRPLKIKQEAARNLAESGKDTPDAQAIRRFADQELRRLNFKALTGIDRRDGHAALFRTHELLGGAEQDWQRLKKITAYLQQRGEFMWVRERSLADWIQAVVVVLAILMMCLFLVGSLTVLAAIAKSSAAMTFGQSVFLLIALTYALGALTALWQLVNVLWHMFWLTREVRLDLLRAAESLSVGPSNQSGASRSPHPAPR